MSRITLELLTLPSEVIAKICSFLPPYSVCQLELSSSVARHAVEMGSVWRKQVEELARETSSEFLCSMLAFAKEEECRVPAVFKTVLRVRLKMNTMVEEIKTWLLHCPVVGIVLADNFVEANPEGMNVPAKKWEVEVRPIVIENGQETDHMLAKIFEEGIKDVERKYRFLKELHSFKCQFLKFSVRLEVNVLTAYFTKISDDDMTDLSDQTWSEESEEWSEESDEAEEWSEEIDTDENDN
eukprot:GFUD01022984.1.p1 GENE.GFUD01022984.1~~GFUD01022984.1.p1  ORF type:complete len:240 (+),score=76.87 GFUD01022984.1:64-783(+)